MHLIPNGARLSRGFARGIVRPAAAAPAHAVAPGTRIPIESSTTPAPAPAVNPSLVVAAPRTLGASAHHAAMLPLLALTLLTAPGPLVAFVHQAAMHPLLALTLPIFPAGCLVPGELVHGLAAMLPVSLATAPAMHAADRCACRHGICRCV